MYLFTMKRIIPLFAFVFALITFNACTEPQANETETKEQEITKSEIMSTENHVFEIAVRKVKAGMLDTFKEKRTAFISELKKEDVALVDREFESFYALPQPDDSEVYIGMTEWSSMEAASEVGQRLSSTQLATDFFSTLDFKAYLYAKPIEGPPFDLASLAAKPGQVLEIAVRSINPGMEAEFQASRKEFVEMLSQQEGALESYELEVVFSQSDQNLAVGMTVYESQEKFQTISASIMQDALTQKYFSTFAPVAVQYAFSSTNQ